MLLIFIHIVGLFQVVSAVGNSTLDSTIQSEPWNWIKNFTVNESQWICAEQGSDITLVCELNYVDVLHRTRIIGPNVTNQETTLYGNGIQAKAINLGCRAGIYNCTVDTNGLDINQIVESLAFVSVKCPPRINTPHDISRNNTPLIRYCEQQRISITFEVYCYPEPTEFDLKQYSDTNLLEMNSDEYVVSSFLLTPPVSLVVVSIKTDVRHQSPPFVLTVKNGMNPDLEVWFEPQSQEEKSALYITIGTETALIFVLIINILAIYLRLRKARKKIEEKDGKPPVQSDVSDSTYITPIDSETNVYEGITDQQQQSESQGYTLPVN